MTYRIAVATAVLLACAFAVRGHENMFRVDLVPSGSLASLDEPV